MLLIENKDFKIKSASRLVKAAEVAEIAKAGALIAAAEAEAAKIRADAEEIYRREAERGYANGLEQGHRKITEQKTTLALESVAFMERVEGKMADVVMKALRKCVSEIAEPELVARVVHKIMDAVVRNQRRITIKVAPKMLAEVKSRMGEILRDYPTVDYADVQEDARLTGTACTVETEAGIAEASVDTQIAAIAASIKTHFAKER